MEEKNKTDNRKNNGGARAGSGKKALPDGEKKVTVSFQIKSKFVGKAKLELQKIVDKINNQKD